MVNGNEDNNVDGKCCIEDGCSVGFLLFAYAIVGVGGDSYQEWHVGSAGDDSQKEGGAGDLGVSLFLSPYLPLVHLLQGGQVAGGEIVLQEPDKRSYRAQQD